MNETKQSPTNSDRMRFADRRHHGVRYAGATPLGYTGNINRVFIHACQHVQSTMIYQHKHVYISLTQ